MLTHLATTIILILVLLTGFVPNTALASDGDDGNPGTSTERTRSNDPIWEGLCVGASLDLSQSSQKKCARQLETANEQNRMHKDEPPNIDAGLCVGASLDLSKKSQAKCARANPPQPTPTPTPTPAETPKDHKLDANNDGHRKHNDEPEAKDQTNRHDKDGQPNIKPETTDAPVQKSNQYVALGDSVAAGLGLTSPIGDDERCGRTFDAYPYTVANARGMEIAHLACSDATMGDIITNQGVSGPNIAPQIDGAFASGTPELITITAGANDVHWDTFIRKCYTRTCGTPNDQKAFNGLITVLGVKLQSVLKDIELRSNGSPPEVIITGYYDPLSDQCAQIEPRLEPEELTWINARTADLNQTLEHASSQYSFVSFAPIDFTGHDICSDFPWVQTLDDPAPFHPTYEGQVAIAQAIL